MKTFSFKTLILTIILAAAATMSIAQETTPEMLEAARKEGSIVWYTAVDVKAAELIAQAFRNEYPGINVEVERAGSERVFQRLEQEYGAGIHNVDVVNSSDASHFVYWKDKGILASHLPPDAELFEPQFRDPDNQFATWRAHLSVIGYNTDLVPEEEAPTSLADLLDSKWKSRMVKAHPGYSGTIVTATQAIVNVLGWEYFEQLAQQDFMQVQSSTAPPKSIAMGERMVMADGNEYNMFTEIQNGSPVAIVYAAEGTPFIDSPSAVLADAPHPNAARVFQNYLFSAPAQQILVNDGGLRSVHPDVTEPGDRTPLSEISILYTDANQILENVEELKARYSQLFGE
jgi:iron(III) transport system substrate-binding protein